MIKKINVAIDGHSSCGKSTLARDLARQLNYIYIDSGAMYRAITWYCQKNGLTETRDIILHLDSIDIKLFTENQTFRLELNEEDITSELSTIQISSFVSEVAAIPEVRKKLVGIQKEIGRNKGVVMDGRDIGTVVLKDAELKLFVTANLDVRTQRRYLELIEKKMDTPLDIVRDNLLKRDHIDSTRKDSPLRKAEDAITIDNSFMTKEEQLYLVKRLVDERVSQ